MAQSKFLFSKLLLTLLWYSAVSEHPHECFLLNQSTSLTTDVMCIDMKMSLVSTQIVKFVIPFRKIDSLLWLKLSNIEFENPALSYNWLDAPAVLQRLEINEFNVVSIEENAFASKHFEFLEIIELINAPIEVFKAGALNGLSRLRTLRMEFINIHEFQGDVFAPASNLEIFILKDCGDQVLNIDNLFGNTDLNEVEYITINRCNLKDTITAKTFSGLYNIDKMNLNSNQIERIAAGSFDYILQRTLLRALFLEMNQLTSIPRYLFKHKGRRTVKVYLNDNPLDCDCQLDQFRAFAIRAKNIEFSLMACASPPEFKNEMVQFSGSFCRVDVPNEPDI